ncbi:B-block-TFIIIC domain-containing protein [Mycena kentingensis (nom. inval.)]|nr:B-block-TFIIIC domain-containing protein [Mycena kentingensis (nom. inval.)]
MDELLRHCLREISYDGDLGCPVERLRDFIAEFYRTGRPQNTDDAFCAFVWSLVVQEPTVIVGTLPDGITSEVWIAPQNSQKRKAKEKGEELALNAPPALEVVPDAKSRPLDHLKAEYGDKLRIATNPDTTYAAITGTHIRFPKMSPMVYTALQIITRGREDGVTVVQLGQRSTYDQKTCFYLVKQLTELDLIVKVRRGGVGTHFCIHKYFFERSDSWRAIREEETRATAALEAAEEAAELPEEDGEQQPTPVDPAFTPIDARHLSSLPLLKARVIKLLKISKNQMHASHNMLLAIGFSHPTRTDRRFFTARMRELVEQRVVECVFVANKRPTATSNGIKCYRLPGSNAGGSAAIVPAPSSQAEDDADEQSGVKVNTIIHKQLITLIEESGKTGMTLSELTTALGQFDRRTIELLLTRAEKYPPPAHLRDLGIAGLMETKGRERRNRYYTLQSYQTLVANENLDKSSAGYSNVDLAQVGGFSAFAPELFWTSKAALEKHQDQDLRALTTYTDKSGKPKGRNPILADGTIKKGRPRKHPEGEGRRKRKQPEGDAGERDNQRPKKKAKTGDASNAAPGNSGAVLPAEPSSIVGPQDLFAMVGLAGEYGPIAASSISSEPIVPKRKGRPPKNPPADGEVVVPKKRGRPKKNPDDASSSTPRASGRLRAKKAPPEPAQLPDVSAEGEKDANVPLPEDRLLDLAHAPAEHLHTTPPYAPPSMDVEMIPLVATLPTTAASLPASMTSTPDAARVPLIVDKEFAPLSPTELPLSLPDISLQPQLGELEPEKTDYAMMVEPAAPLPIEEFFVPQPAAVANSSLPVGRHKVNVSTLRRDNELFRVLELLGGVANTQTKEIFEVHMSLLQTLADAGEPASAPPNTYMDRRTCVNGFNNLEAKGRVKQFKTTITSLTGLSRPANVVYLPHITEEQISAFLVEQGRSTAQFPPLNADKGIVVDADTEYGSKWARKPLRSGVARLMLNDINGKSRAPNPDRANELFGMDEETIREALLTERTTFGQLYGFIPAKMVRARTFHKYCLSVFESGNASPGIVSHQERLASFAYFYSELPLGIYTSVVACVDGNDQLLELLRTEKGQSTPVKDLPPSLHTLLQISRTRGRGRILEMLDILRLLGLAQPCVPTSVDKATVTCAPNGEFPTAFEEDFSLWSIDTTVAAPTYWRFLKEAPVFNWYASETSPPFLRNMDVSTVAAVNAYWDYLRRACLGSKDDPVHVTADPPPPYSVLLRAQRKAKSYRRRISWEEGYFFTWHQTHYLNRRMNGSQGYLALDGSDEQLEHVANIISAPVEDVRQAYEKAVLARAAALDKATRRIQRELRIKEVDAEAKASLAKRAAEALAVREAKWEALVTKVHPDPLPEEVQIRLKRIRTNYLQSTGTHVAKWQKDIARALNDANLAIAPDSLTQRKRNQWIGKQKPKFQVKVAEPGPSQPIPTPLPPVAYPPDAPPLVINPPEKSVASLIAAQGPAIVERSRSKKRKQLEVEVDTEPTASSGPRTRFHWNKDYEELLKDAYVIVSSRCRTRSKLDYGMIKAVFPGVPKPGLRTHLKALRDGAGAATYLTRLEEHWHQLWVQYRGSVWLPDENVLGTKFDLAAHVEFLRKHVDKNAIRVGFAEDYAKSRNVIPATVDALLQQFDVFEQAQATPSWDFLFTSVVDENREKRALRQAMTMRADDLVLGIEESTEKLLLAESALKMTMGTAMESYDPLKAAVLLHEIGESTVQAAHRNLLSRGVLSKAFKNPNSRPGRMLKISELNGNAIGGSVPPETFKDAAELEEISAADTNTWREWPLLSTDGDAAALIQLVSENKVRFKIDTSAAQAAREIVDWNSKKADDDHIETALFIRFHDLAPPQTPSPIQTQSLTIPVDTVAEHGTTVDNAPACCKLVAEDSLIDCPACLEEDWGALYASLDAKDRDTTQLVLDAVMASGQAGIGLKALADATGLPSDAIRRCIQLMTETSAPPLFWAGYLSLVLVSSAYLRAWSVQISTAPMTRVFPRRWLDMTGSRVVDRWVAATRAVMGMLVFHPGITQAQLRWRLRSVYDRQEISEILQYFVEGGMAEWPSPSFTIHVTMRSKQLLSVLPAPAKAKLVWERLTFSRLTTIYALFSLLHFGLQVGLQIQAFLINASAAHLLYDVALQGHATDSSFPALAGSQIRMCSTIPTSLNTDNCTVVYDGVPSTSNHLFNPDNATQAFASGVDYAAGADAPTLGLTAATSSDVVSSSVSDSSVNPSPSGLVTVVRITQTITSIAATPLATTPTGPVIVAPAKRAVGAWKPTAKVLSISNDTTLVNITGMGYQNYPLWLDNGCMWSLNWPVSILDNTKREDIVFIAFQFWVLGMSIVALLNESMPHVIASLLTHVLATAWSGFQISQTAAFRGNFNHLITKGACNGVPSLLPTYWEDRARAEVPTLALNALGLVVSSVLTWKLVKLFGWQTFKRVGASLTIKRVYHLVLFFSIVLQLGLFFMGATVSLFLDQLINGWAGHMAWYSVLYKAMFIVTGLLLIPWLVSGWYSVRREKRWGMVFFLAISLWYLAGWAVMFLSTTFRWTFETWNFFAIVASFSIFFSLLAFLLGVVCRYNFGKGLLRYLNTEESLPGDDFERVVSPTDEKVSFPTSEKPVPTYSATFGSGSEAGSQFTKASPQLGPRFFNSSAVPFESRSNSASSSPIAAPMAALTRTSTNDSYRSAGTTMTALPQHMRNNSQGSLQSYYDYSAGDSNHMRRDSESTTMGGNKRWVIDV